MSRRPTPPAKPARAGKGKAANPATPAELPPADDAPAEPDAAPAEIVAEEATPADAPLEAAQDEVAAEPEPAAEAPTPEPPPAPEPPPPAPAEPRARRLLIASHSHPAISKGGAELAAWRMYESFRDLPDWDAWFMGCGRDSNGGARLGSVITQPFGADQFLYASGQFDWFKFSNNDERFPREFAELLRNTRPDILHFHHYVNFGMEAFLIAKRELPDCKIVLTLHEYQAICNHYGQMVTKANKSLCYESRPRDCNKCFPDTRAADFFLRQAYIQRFMALVDHFISPSEFLADRYIAWGLPAEKMSVIENVIAVAKPVAAEPPRNAKGPLRVGFFGQISFLKGIHVLLDAALMLENEEVEDIVFEVHGDYSNQPAEFQADFVARMAKAGRNVRFNGPYDNTRVDALMRSCDVILIPSIWWENSPVVIQECLRNRRPIIASNIGGMAEKVREGVDGWHFNVGNAIELGALLRDLAENREQIAAVRETMRMPPTPEDAVSAHLAIYDTLAPA
jgi:glycosyltransferase involved in cell wall biosynthesis